MSTIKDIARELRLSPSVISRALNPRPDPHARVAAETRRLIEETAFRLGYRRNRIAEFMQRGKAATIGVFIPEFANRLVADLMFGISETAAEQGFPLNFYPGMSDVAYRDFIQANLKNPGSGIISYPYRIAASPEIRQLLEQYRIHGGKVLLLNTPPMPGFTTLSMDEQNGGRLAAECLLEHQCHTYLVNNHFDARAQGFMTAMAKAGIGRHAAAFKNDEAETFFRRALDRRRRLGVFAVTDADALRFLRIFNRLDARVGREVFLVGYDDLELTELVDPPLTTIRQPFREQGRRAVEKLLGLIYGEQEADELVQPQLVCRESA